MRRAVSRTKSENAGQVLQHSEHTEQSHLDGREEDEREDSDQCCFQHAPIITSPPQNASHTWEEFFYLM